MTDEQQLVSRAKRGDQEAFAALVRDNQDRIYTLALRMAGSPEDGADLAQEAFLRAWRALPSFQGDSSFSTWLYRLTRNLCIDFLRRERRREAVTASVSLDDDGESAPIQVSDPRFSPERQLECRELRAALDRALAKLSDDHRQVLVLRESEGLSYREIAQALGVEEGTVKSRLARARLALRKILLSDGNFSPPAPSMDTRTNGREGTA
jgi:RNA polymerase sigma-70 factor (ECF subfamily)